MELSEVFYLIKRGEKRTTKRKDSVRVPKMEGEDEKGKTSGRSSFSGYRPAEKEESKEIEVEISNKV